MGKHNYKGPSSDEEKDRVHYVKIVYKSLKDATQDIKRVVQNYYDKVPRAQKVFFDVDQFYLMVLKKIKERQEKKLEKNKRPEKKNPGSQGFISL